MIIINILRIPLWFFESIERKYTYGEPHKRTRQIIKPERISRKIEPTLPDFDELDTDSWAKWIKEHPDKVSANKNNRIGD
jgi:hypothetical protein